MTKRFSLALIGAALSLGVMAAMASASITAPTIDVTPLYTGVVNALTTNLPTILLGAGILGGVFFVLRMARRWFGARSHA